MTTHPELVAARRFDVLDAQGRPVDSLTVHLGLPREEPQGEWSSAVRLRGLGDERVCPAYGADAIQALELAIQLAGIQLAQMHEEHAGRRLRWRGGVRWPIAAPMKVEPRQAMGSIDIIASRSVEMLDERGRPRDSFHDGWQSRARRPGQRSLRKFSPRQAIASIAIGRPSRITGRTWTCAYVVRALDVEETIWISGRDGLHALRGALMLIAGAGADDTALVNRCLFWQEHAELGLPVPRPLSAQE